MKMVVMSVLLLLMGCPFKKAEKKANGSDKFVESAYEVLPGAPIPPENRCYELYEGEGGKDLTTLVLTVMGDSVFGTLDAHVGQSNESKGVLVGTLYDKTLLAAYKQGNGKPEDQEWKVFGDTAYRKISQTLLPDSAKKNITDSVQVTIYPLLHKVTCK